MLSLGEITDGRPKSGPPSSDATIGKDRGAQESAAKTRSGGVAAKVRLFAFVDSKDPFATGEITGEEIPGPILAIMNSRHFDAVFLFCTGVRGRTQQQLKKSCPEGIRSAPSVCSNCPLPIQRITHHGLEIARLQPGDQEKALLECFPGHRSTGSTLKDRKAEALTVRQLRQWIEREIHLDLKNAPFDTEDANLLPAAGACSTCPKRTGNNRLLFPEIKNRSL